MEEFIQGVSKLPVELWVGLITAMATMFAGLIKYINIKHTRLISQGQKVIEESRQAINEVQNSQQAFGLDEFVFHWTDVGSAVEELCSSTNIDRFLMLKAFNGKSDPEWTTAFFQMRDSKIPVMQYVHYPLDDDYVRRLHKIRTKGPIHTETAKMEEGGLKDIYEAEGVTASYLTHIVDVPISDEKIAIFYCSFATVNGNIDKASRTKCDILVGRLKQIARNYYNPNNIWASLNNGAIQKI